MTHLTLVLCLLCVQSSILHAIQIVFGAKAADTNRGKSIDKLVSHGKHMAEICVWIKNHKGPSAYKHELYGDEIQLTRRITVTQTAAGKSTATSAYTMSGVMENGKPYSTRSSHDVNEMCEAFNIQVSNPCVLMTQEVSKVGRTGTRHTQQERTI